MKLHLLLAYSTLAQIQVKKYYGEGFILSCTVRCDRRTRRFESLFDFEIEKKLRNLKPG